MTTQTTPSRAKRLPSYAAVELSSNMPPWIHTITGKPGARRGSGVQTFRFRQSSEGAARSTAANAPATSPQSSAAPGSGPPVDGGATCGGSGPSRVASRTPLHASTGCGGRSRRSPNGGAAYGTPRNTCTPSATHALHRSMRGLDHGPAEWHTRREDRGHDTPPRARTDRPGPASIIPPARTGDDDLTRRSHIDCPRAGAGPLAGSPRARASFHGGPSTRPSNIDRVDANQYPGSRDGADTQGPQPSSTVGCAGRADL